MTDGDLPVPGTAVVNFNGQANTSCVRHDTPTAATGYALDGVLDRLFRGELQLRQRQLGRLSRRDRSGVHVQRRRPTSRTSAPATSYRFGSTGGTVSNANKLSNLGQTLGTPEIGKDGSIYVTRGATTGNFTTGAIYQIDPMTGATIRTVASNLTCPAGLAVDPLSGDLFFDDACSGAGSDNPSIFRISNPSERHADRVGLRDAAAVGQRLDVVSRRTARCTSSWAIYNTVSAGHACRRHQHVAAAVDHARHRRHVDLLGHRGRDAAERCGQVADRVGMRRRSISSTSRRNPPTVTKLLNSPTSSGVIGPDGCLYTSASDTVFRMSKAERVLRIRTDESAARADADAAERDAGPGARDDANPDRHVLGRECPGRHAAFRSRSSVRTRRFVRLRRTRRARRR